MSHKISRRSFLKYSALTAAAVAGSGLFTGCSWFDAEVEELHGTGAMTVLKVTCELTSYTFGTNSAEFSLKITNGRDNPIAINAKYFLVEVTHTDSTTSTTDKYVPTVADELRETNLKTDNSLEGKLTVDNMSVSSGDTVTLTYVPDTEYPENLMRWILTVS